MFVATILAFAFFAYDLGRPLAATSSPIEALINFSHSWMARGIIFVSGLLLFSLLYTFSVFLKLPQGIARKARIIFAVLGMLLEYLQQLIVVSSLLQLLEFLLE